MVGQTAGVDTAADVERLCREQDVRFLSLRFADILGSSKSLTLPVTRLAKALAGEVIVDGSAIEGFVRLREADLFLRPDPRTFVVLPRQGDEPAHAQLVCDLYGADGMPFPEDPRLALRRAGGACARLGFVPMVGAEPEFFLFRRDASGRATTETNDLAGYFDAAPMDTGEGLRHEMVGTLMALGLEIEGAHHEAAPGQHEIDFRHTDALAMADSLVLGLRTIRIVAARHGMHATFMPKPLADVNGSGLHVHLSLSREGVNAFYDAERPDGLSAVARQFLAGLLRHARGLTAVTNPLVNSYKRLVPGYEAPSFVTWSQREHSPWARVPTRRGSGTRIEVRSPDPACNPYLAFTALLAAGLDGLARRAEPPRQAGASVYRMSSKEREELGIVRLPANLAEALDAFEEDEVIQEALGAEICSRFIEAKRIEWEYYERHVHAWELEQYLTAF